VDTDYGIVKTFISDEQARQYGRGDAVALRFNRRQEYALD